MTTFATLPASNRAGRDGRHAHGRARRGAPARGALMIAMWWVDDDREYVPQRASYRDFALCSKSGHAARRKTPTAGKLGQQAL